MRLAHVVTDTGPQWVCEDGDGSLRAIDDVTLTTDWAPEVDLGDIVEPLAWLPPVPHLGRIFCVGLNYRSHADESGLELPSTPVLFAKFANTAVGHGHGTRIPVNVEHVDYEAELVIVMGARCHQVSPENALDFVAGYCNGNDLSARTLQLATSQWLMGKTLDGFAPMGPYLVTPDDVPDPDDLTIRCWVNGEMRQEDRTSSMIFSCGNIISYLSQYVTLEAGDVIFTGTPAGVVLGRSPGEQRWLNPGDVVEVEVERLGRLVTTLEGVGDD